MKGYVLEGKRKYICINGNWTSQDGINRSSDPDPPSCKYFLILCFCLELNSSPAASRSTTAMVMNKLMLYVQTIFCSFLIFSPSHHFLCLSSYLSPVFLSVFLSVCIDYRYILYLTQICIICLLNVFCSKVQAIFFFFFFFR